MAYVGARLESESLGLGPAEPCDPSLPGLLFLSVLRLERPPPAPVSHECVRTDEMKQWALFAAEARREVKS